jgi:Ca-activated chloride channel family protein
VETGSIAAARGFGERPRLIIIIIIIFFPLLLGSCSGVSAKLRVMAGNLLAGRNRHAEAITNYLEALNNGEAAPYAEYGLGSLYLAMDEDEAALGRFAAAETALGAGHGELRYRLSYNRGVILFERGDYSGAAGAFRKALEHEGSHIEAKRNLELSLLSLERQSREQAAPPSGQGESAAEDILFDYMRRREEQRWRNQEWTEEASPSGPDY